MSIPGVNTLNVVNQDRATETREDQIDDCLTALIFSLQELFLRTRVFYTTIQRLVKLQLFSRQAVSIKPRTTRTEASTPFFRFFFEEGTQVGLVSRFS